MVTPCDPEFPSCVCCFLFWASKKKSVGNEGCNRNLLLFMSRSQRNLQFSCLWTYVTFTSTLYSPHIFGGMYSLFGSISLALNGRPCPCRFVQPSELICRCCTVETATESQLLSIIYGSLCW